jgi:hypothetical protein
MYPASSYAMTGAYQQTATSMIPTGLDSDRVWID